MKGNRLLVCRVSPIQIGFFRTSERGFLIQTKYLTRLLARCLQKQLFVGAALLFGFVNIAAAEDLVIYIAPADSQAHAAASDLGLGPVERRIHKGFNLAADHLGQCGKCEVVINIAGGDYAGKARVGTWVFPEVSAMQSSLKILGGWNEDFTARNPFATPTVLRSNENRSSVVLSFAGRKHGFKELVVSGLTFDTTPSNRYDAQTNSLLKGGSSTYAQLAFGYITTDRLVIADNTFMSSSSGGVGGPIVRPIGSSGEVRLENNVFFNNVLAWTLASGSYSNPPDLYLIKGNSFILNWPYNADVTTSNPGALEIGNKRTANRVVIEDNLFAYNYGGAIFPQWDDTRGPQLAVNNNLFYGNGGMFGATASGSGAFVGKFVGAATHSIFSSEEVEDDFDWEVSGNVSIDPDLDLGVPQTVGLTSVGERDEGRSESLQSSTDTVLDEAEDAASELGSDLEAELAQLGEALDLTTDELSADSTADSAPELDLDLGLDLGLDFDDYESDGVGVGADDLQNYAPKIAFQVGALPFPDNTEAQRFGASPERVTQYQ